MHTEVENETSPPSWDDYGMIRLLPLLSWTKMNNKSQSLKYCGERKPGKEIKQYAGNDLH